MPGLGRTRFPPRYLSLAESRAHTNSKCESLVTPVLREKIQSNGEFIFLIGLEALYQAEGDTAGRINFHVKEGLAGSDHWPHNGNSFVRGNPLDRNGNTVYTVCAYRGACVAG